MIQPSLSKVWHEHNRLKALLANIEETRGLLMNDNFSSSYLTAVVSFAEIVKLPCGAEQQV